VDHEEHTGVGIKTDHGLARLTFPARIHDTQKWVEKHRNRMLEGDAIVFDCIRTGLPCIPHERRSMQLVINIHVES